MYGVELHVNFNNYENAFDSIHRDSLWEILRAYGIPQHIVNIIKCSYSNFICCVRVGQGDLSFGVKTGVRQGCVVSSVLFNIAIDWVLHRIVEDQRRGIRWTPFFYTRTRLRRRFSSIVPHLAAHTGEDRPAQYIQQRGWLDN